MLLYTWILRNARIPNNIFLVSAIKIYLGQFDINWTAKKREKKNCIWEARSRHSISTLKQFIFLCNDCVTQCCVQWTKKTQIILTTTIHSYYTGTLTVLSTTDGFKFILDFKSSSCSECCVLSFGWFPGVWISYSDVSGHPVCSIFIGCVSLFTQTFIFRRFGTHCLFHLHTPCKLTYTAFYIPTFRNTLSAPSSYAV